ncbi:hypothetical protein HMPREF1869_00928, partial [Bacteroidales bacterium KA00251]
VPRDFGKSTERFWEKFREILRSRVGYILNPMLNLIETVA